jgi:hypothetical protein
VDRYYGEKRDVYGRVEPGATVTVYVSGTNTLANLYLASENLVTPVTGISNPLQTDANGQYGFAAADGYYDINVQGSGSIEYLPKVGLGSASLSASLAGPTGAAQIGYLAPYSGAVARTVATKDADWLNAKDFGTIGDGSADDTAALQLAITTAIVNGKRLLVPSGTYKITSPLLAQTFNAGTWSYFTLHIEGEKSKVGYTQPATVIAPTFNNAPALVIQQGRGVCVKSIVFRGTNDLYTVFSNSSNFYKVMTAANMNTNASRDSQYSPYCGVAVDPFSSGGGAAGYPTLSAYYTGTTAGSSDTLFEDCYFNNFIVGVALTPNAANQNNDQVTFRNCMLGFNKVGLAIGQSQSRGIILENCQLYSCYTGVDGMSYGLGTGGSLKVYGGISVNCKYLFNMSSTRQDSFLISGFYSEALGGIGFFSTTGSTQTGVSFQGCAFNFTDFSGVGPYADFHFHTYSPTVFEGCFFGTINQTNQGALRFQNPSGAPISFKGCHFCENSVGELMLGPSQGINGTDWTAIYFDGCAMSESQSYGAGLISELTHRAVVFAGSNPDRIPSPMGQLITYTGGTLGQLLLNGSLWGENQVSLGSLTLTVASNGVGTFTATDGTIIKIGDLLYADDATAGRYDGPTGPATVNVGRICVGTVKNVVGNNVTVNGVPQSMPTGSYALYTRWNSRAHQASVGTTNSTTTISSVSNPATWKNGHHIKGSGIPAGAYIVSGGGTATLTISKATTSSLGGTRLWDANLQVITGSAL